MKNISVLTTKSNTVAKSIAAALFIFSIASPTAYAGAIRDSSLFTANTLPANDDDSSDLVDLGFTINFYGTNFSQTYVNNNGNITFDSSQTEYTPYDLSTTNRQILAPFFADVDTRAAGSQLVQYGQAVIGGRNTFGVNWIDVGYFDHQDDKLNRFQLIITDRSDVLAGDFDFEFNYDQILWETGSASDGVNGFGGDSARVGWSNGAANTFELSGSAVDGAFLNGGISSLIANSLNSGVAGRYVFQVRNGEVVTVPVPAGLPLFLSGLAILGWRGRKQG